MQISGTVSMQGRRAKLDMSHIPELRMFPGQIIALRGINPSGDCIIASALLPPSPLPSVCSTAAQLQDHADATGVPSPAEPRYQIWLCSGRCCCMLGGESVVVAQHQANHDALAWQLT